MPVINYDTLIDALTIKPIDTETQPTNIPSTFIVGTNIPTSATTGSYINYYANYGFSEPEYVGAIPIRQDINIAPKIMGDPYVNDYYDNTRKQIMAEEDARIYSVWDSYNKSRQKVNINLTYDNTMDWIDANNNRIKIGDMVKTPLGRGLLCVIDEETYCVELDPKSNLLHEFNKDEIKKDGL